jgi:hypothetical protein
MNQTARYIIASAVCILIAITWYVGSYEPFQKSQTFVHVLSVKNGFQSLQELEDTFSTALDYPSPIGQEELVRNTGSYILNFAQQSNDTAVIVPLVQYITRYFGPVISRGRGMSFGQDLYLMGVLNEVTLVKTKDPKYLQAAHLYYAQALELGPKRPQALFGMFDIYRFEGDVQNTTRIANQILAQWPTDTRTKSALDAFLKSVGK